MQLTWIWRSHPTSSYQIGAYHVTPIAHTVGVRWHSGDQRGGERHCGGWLWQLPLAIHVYDQVRDTRTRHLVFDVTRLSIWFLGALALSFSIVRVLTASRSR
jgi:hypothetical protein